MANVNTKYGSYTALTVTHLQSLANSATAGWQSAVVDNTSTLALDYEIAVSLPMANTAPAAPQLVSVYVAPAVYTGSAWIIADQGTTTLPTGSEGTTTIAAQNDLTLLGTLYYETQNMTLQGVFMLSSAVGQNIPDGFVVIIVNNSGAAIAASAAVVAYKAVTQTVV